MTPNPYSRPTIDPGDAIRSLASTTCPACGCSKSKGHTFCGACYFKLDQITRRCLYRKVGEGYEPAVADALSELGAARMTMPPAPTAAVDPQDQAEDMFE